MALVLPLLLALPGCPAPMRRVEVVSPLRGGSLPVHVVNQPSTVGAHGPTVWRHECQAIPRLGADETRAAWLRRVETYVEQQPTQLSSISYPPGGAVEEALVCFSVETPYVPRATRAAVQMRDDERPPR